MLFTLYPSVTLININDHVFTFMADSLLDVELILNWWYCRIMSHMNRNILFKTCLDNLCWAVLRFNKETLKKLLKMLPLGICCTFSIQELQHSYILPLKLVKIALFTPTYVTGMCFTAETCTFRMFKVKTGAEKQKAKLVSGCGFDTKGLSKKRDCGGTKTEWNEGAKRLHRHRGRGGERGGAD